MVFNQNFKNIVFCLTTGLLAVCAFPKIDLFFLVWIAFVPLIFAIMKTGLKGSFFYGFISGFIFNAIGLYWLVPMLQFNIGSYVQVVTAACALWMYLALYWGMWGLCLNFSKNILKSVFHSNIFTALFAASAWVLLEYIRTYLLTGFPWMLIGYSQFKFTGIIQVAEFTGVYGVSFLVIFCNLCFYFWISAKREKLKSANSYLYLALMLIIAVSIFGLLRINKFRSFGSQEFSVAVVQPNVDQYKKWNKFYENDILLDYEKYAFEISNIKADLVVWPETALVGVIPRDRYSYDRAKCIVDATGGFNIVGSLYNDENNRVFNVVLTFENGGDYKVLHKKNHLVPFGEFVPFRALFSRFFGILNQTGDTTKGEDIEIFSNGEMQIGSTICSENFFPDISRKFALMGAKVFTNHTNDAWFFDTAAPYQHFVMNVFRAVENRKSFIVSANSGISGIIEASGLVVRRTLSAKKTLLTGKFFQNDFKTFYTKYGDLFVGVCAGLFLVLVLLGLRIKIRKA